MASVFVSLDKILESQFASLTQAYYGPVVVGSITSGGTTGRHGRDFSPPPKKKNLPPPVSPPKMISSVSKLDQVWQFQHQNGNFCMLLWHVFIYCSPDFFPCPPPHQNVYAGATTEYYNLSADSACTWLVQTVLGEAKWLWWFSNRTGSQEQALTNANLLSLTFVMHYSKKAPYVSQTRFKIIKIESGKSYRKLVGQLMVANS